MELLIRSHDCYTLGCSVDGRLVIAVLMVVTSHTNIVGIGDVLVVAQNWVQKLVEGKHFKLMVQGFSFSLSMS